jgi:type IV pilus assembly protein PilA
MKLLTLSHLSNDNSNQVSSQGSSCEKGFTLIELLVAVIIIGVLAALGIPNLLSQVGKARDTELRSTVGTINRAQQAFHFEKRYFSSATDELGVKVTLQYQTQPSLVADPSGNFATVTTQALNYLTNGTKAFSGMIEYNTNGEYLSILCGSNSPAQNIVAPPSISSCPSGAGPVR